MKTFSVHTLGCRANQADSERLAEILVGGGFRQVPWGTPADLQVVNTCTVTREADRKSGQMVRRAERQAAEGVVVATGCGVAARGGLKGVSSATLRLPPDRQEEILALLGAQDCPTSRPDRLTQKRHRALLRVQDGCDQFCTFCIVPYVRGRSRSFDPGALASEARALEAAGFKEIVLTGVHLSAWGLDFSPPQGLHHLIQLLLESTREVRFRLSSVEPDLFPEQIFQLMARYPRRLCPHLHLVLQHASDRILQRMHRGYDQARYAALVGEFLKCAPEACLTSDVMVGFPGETEEDFEQLRCFIDRTPYYHLHVFPYSSRPGTAAAKFPQTVPVPVQQRRRDELIRLGEKKRRQFQRSSLGQIHQVLVEECAPSRGWVQGTAGNYLAVRLRGGPAMVSTMAEVRLERIRLEWMFAGFPLS